MKLFRYILYYSDKKYPIIRFIERFLVKYKIIKDVKQRKNKSNNMLDSIEYDEDYFYFVGIRKEGIKSYCINKYYAYSEDKNGNFYYDKETIKKHKKIIKEMIE